MKKGRKPKPTNLKLVNGNPGKRKLNEDEAQPDLEIPTAPDFLGKHALVEWGRITEQLYALGLLTSIDRAALAAYCQCYHRWYEAELEIEDKGMIIKTSNGNIIQSPYVGIANKSMKMMRDFMAEFGMTPSSRSSVKAAPPKKEGKKGFAAL